MPLVHRLVATKVHLFRVREFRFGLGYVHRDVDDDRSGATRGGDIERLLDDARQVFHVLDEIIVLGDGPRDPRDVGLLKSVVADHLRRDLAREDDKRNRIHIGRGDAGHQVGRSRAGGRDHHTDPARGAGVTVRGVHRSLFVPREIEIERRIEQLMEDGNDRAARIAENMLHSLLLEGFNDNLSTRHFHGSSPRTRFCCTSAPILARRPEKSKNGDISPLSPDSITKKESMS